MKFLYESFDALPEMGVQIDPLPSYVADNLNPRFDLREYQHDAFKRFIYYINKYPRKTVPIHLLFNMATGSGKTLIMAGLILYLYTQGYRNFLFFVNTTNIIGKTRDNFLNPFSSKYLFNPKIIFDGQVVEVREVNGFQESNPDNINICFTTIQKLHGDLHVEKENCLTFEEFKDQKIVLLSDEAHHIQAATKQKALSTKMDKPNWENTVEKILGQNQKNVLLEFTATINYLNKGIVEKYCPKVIYRYDLKKFRNQGYSKDIHILQSDLDEKERMLQAIIISQYRQEAAGKEQINLKPVILFKAQKTIKESGENQARFNALIENLSEADIQKIREHQSGAELLQRAFRFFSENNITDSVLVKKLAQSFAVSHCLNVNDENLDKKSLKQLDRQQLISQQIILNSLEDSDNQIRAIFAVQKLNEGWDVLNLFDIVRLYNTRDGREDDPGKATVAEAQLIGRGARYFPFTYGNKDRYKRKFDEDIKHPLRILEELHYHSVSNSRYIEELKTALKRADLFDEDKIPFELFVKEEFKKKDLYKSGIIFLNEKIKNKNEKVMSFADLGVQQRNIRHAIATGHSTDEAVLAESEFRLEKTSGKEPKDISLKKIEAHIIRKAMAKNSFYNFDNLKRFFPHISSAREFAESADYLGGLSITFEGRKKDVENLTNRDKLTALIKLLREIEAEVRSNTAEYTGTAVFKPQGFAEVFSDKTLMLGKNSNKAEGQKSFLEDKDWYIFNANYGTSEEKALVRMMRGQIDSLREEHEEVYLVRNEQHFKIYNFKDGAGYAPDFVLFLQQKNGNSISYQIFIEPKGKHLKEYDQWKEDFLQAIEGKHTSIFLGESREHKIIGLPFYNSEDTENKFKEELHSALERYKKKGASNKRDKKAGVDSPS